MRRITTSKGTPPPLGASTEQGTKVWEFTLKALTPIYKGGSDPNQIDPDRPFRGPSIRGQLRVWWRATSEISDPRELWEAEARLFGAVHGNRPVASQVRVGVTAGKSVPQNRPPGDLLYVTWVDRPAPEYMDSPRYHDNAQARLRISVPRSRAGEVERALQAWLLFGGIGGRSRRGLGAVWSDDLEFCHSIQDIESFMKAAGKLVPSNGGRKWPSLAGARVAWAPEARNTALDALRDGVAALREFRAMRHQGGRSFTGSHRPAEFQDDWLTLSRARGHLRGVNAGLGLPLPYQTQHGQVRRFTLMPRGANRYPSPMLIRPVKLGGGYRAMFLLMEGWSEAAIEVSRMPQVQGMIDRHATNVVARELKKQRWNLRTLQGGR